LILWGVYKNFCDLILLVNMNFHILLLALIAAVECVAGNAQPYNNWATSLAQADKILAGLTLAEIANITIENSVSGFKQTPYIDGMYSLKHKTMLDPTLIVS
jgi:hypothetical protein